jgi:hypothetical protein
MIPPSPTPLESVLDLLCSVAPPPVPVMIAIRMGIDAELQVHPLDRDDPLGSADRLAVGADVDAVVAAVPASIHPGDVAPDNLAGTLLHMVARGGESHTRWVEPDGAVCHLSAEPGIHGGQLHQRVRSVLESSAQRWNS